MCECIHSRSQTAYETLLKQYKEDQVMLTLVPLSFHLTEEDLSKQISKLRIDIHALTQNSAFLKAENGAISIKDGYRTHSTATK